MDQSEIIEILNRHVFSQEKAALLQSIAKYPDRFVGVFRSTTPRLKLLQNLLQSREIRFGDALEEIITGLIPAMGFEPLVKRFQTENDDLSCDQYFCTPDRTQYYLIEQKVRDDHDSTKKRGQIENFRKKLEYLKTLHGTSLSGIMYFIDPALHKNEGYYRKEIEALQHRLEIPVALYYNGDLFQHLQGHTQTWDLLLNSLQVWRKTAPEQISLDYDANPELAVAEIAQVPGIVWHKLASTDALWENGVLQALFPTGRTLVLLANRFQELGARKINTGRRGTTYGQLAEMLRMRLKQFYSDQL
jgi:hypothetical protein